jgi:micrococcal nuclease
MQMGIGQIIGGLFVIALLVGGSFAAGSKWNVEAESQEASAATALEDATSTEEIFKDAPNELPLYSVVRVVDGDTIVVNVDGKNESVRMIGVDTPELNDSRTGVQCFAEEASDKTKALVIGKKVRLEKDSSQGDRDKYTRLLAYVFREDGVFVNRTLIAEGFAHEYTYDGKYKYQTELKAAQASAESAEKGLWAEGVCVAAKPVAQPAKAKPKSTPPKTQAAAAAATQPAPAPEPPPASAPATQDSTPVKKEVAPEPIPEPQAESSSSIVCSSNTYNCTDFKTQKEAQSVYDQCGGVGHDIHKLDNNKDGSACDSLR